MSEDAQDVVLVVEDEPAIRMILRDYLAGEGYHVLVAEDGSLRQFPDVYGRDAAVWAALQRAGAAPGLETAALTD